MTDVTISKQIEDCPGIKLNGKSHEIVEKFCYLVDATGTRGGADDSVTTRIRIGWSKFRDFVPVIASRGLPLRRKGKLTL